MAAVIANPLGVSFPHEQFVIADLEVEDILNEIGFFADYENLFLDNQGDDDNVSNFLPPVTVSSGFVPVSPDRGYSSPMTTEATRYTVSPTTVPSSRPIETYQTFSVPNPIAAPITPKEVQKKIVKVEPVVSQAATSAKQDDQEPSVPEKPTEQKNRKRKISSVSDPETKELTGEQMLERRQRNSEHAKRSRLRKKSFTQTVQTSVEELRNENKKLREQIYAMIGKGKVESKMIEMRARSRECFLDAIKNPSNRVVDNSTIAFLKSLQKNLPSH